MHAVIMAGGSGSRIHNPGKMLLKIGGNSLISHVIEELENANIKFSICVSSNTPEVIFNMSPHIIYGNGNYIHDLKLSVNRFPQYVLIISADLLFSSSTLSEFISKSYKIGSGITTLAINHKAVGISIFFEKIGDAELNYTSIDIDDTAFFNINTENDYRRAELYYKR
ncbi:MAG: NTP transferase domain-containing protein [Ferroplasma sp.]